MNKKALVLTLLAIFVSSVSWALIGTPCDPEKDFEKVYMLKNWRQLPHKNQEETEARVAEVNSRQSAIKWTFQPKPNTPLYVCLAYGAASMADWWAVELGWKLGTYRSYTNGQMERGFDPRKLELRYRKRARLNPVTYAMTRLTKRDPVTQEPVPVRPKGFSRILVDDRKEEIKDYIDGTTFKYTAGDYPMEGKWVAVVSKNMNRKSAEKKIIRGLHDLGPLYVQFEIPKKHWQFGTHAPVVVGYGTLKNGKTVFICHDSFGDFKSNYRQDFRGAPAYRYVSADEIDEAIGFPHFPTAKIAKSTNGFSVKFFNKAGKSIKVRRAYYRDNKGKSVQMEISGQNFGWIRGDSIKPGNIEVYVEAEYYMKDNGKGHWLKLTRP